MKKYTSIIVMLLCALSLIALFKMGKNNSVEEEQRKLDNADKNLIKTQANEIASLREDIRFYVDREKGFVEKIAVLTNEVDSLNDVIYNFKSQPKHEKVSIISDSMSAYYTKLLTDRYKTK